MQVLDGAWIEDNEENDKFHIRGDVKFTSTVGNSEKEYQLPVYSKEPLKKDEVDMWDGLADGVSDACSIIRCIGDYHKHHIKEQTQDPKPPYLIDHEPQKIEYVMKKEGVSVNFLTEE